MCDGQGASSRALDEEQPAPASLPEVPGHVQDAVRDEGRHDAADVGGHPEVSKADGELSLCVEVWAGI